MPKLLMLRHGQASFMAADYDNLSPLGTEQSEQLGRYWAATGMVPTRVFVGPRRRHRQTLDAVAQGFKRAGIDLPPAADLPELDEFRADELMRGALPQIAGNHPDIQDLFAEFLRDADNRRINFERVFRAITRLWARGEIEISGETWRDFRRRVELAMATMMRDTRSGDRVLAVSSGGPVAAATAAVLGLDDDTAMTLTWNLRNAAYSEIVYAGQYRALVSFGNTGFLSEKRLLTYR